MNKNLTSQLELLKLLSCCKEKYRKAILQNSDKELVQALCECVYNLLNGNVEIDSKTREILHKYKHQLRNLCQKTTLKQKRKILVQKGGGFLQYLLPAVLPALISLIKNEVR